MLKSKLSLISVLHITLLQFQFSQFGSAVYVSNFRSTFIIGHSSVFSGTCLAVRKIFSLHNYFSFKQGTPIEACLAIVS